MKTLFSFVILGLLLSLGAQATTLKDCGKHLAEAGQAFILEDHLQTALSALATKSPTKVVRKRNWDALAASPEISSVLRQGPVQEETVKTIYAELLKTRSPKAAVEYIKEVIHSFEDAKKTREILESYSASSSQKFIEHVFSKISEMDPSFQTDRDFLAKLVENFSFIKLLNEFSSPAIPENNIKPEHVARILGMPRMNRSFEVAIRSIFNLLLILKGDHACYESFIKSQDSRSALTWDSFQERHNEVRRVIQNSEDLHAMITYLIINDLGKSTLVANSMGVFDPYADHDTLLTRMLNSGRITPFEKLSSRYKKIIELGATGAVNSAQLRQGENLAAHLKNGVGIGEEAMRWFLINDFVHVSAFLAPMNPIGSPIWNEPLNGRDLRMQSKLVEMAKSTDPKAHETAYRGFIESEAQQLGLDSSTPIGFATTRLSLMLRYYDRAKAMNLQQILETHPLKNSLVRYLTTIDDSGTLVYFAPDFLRLMSTPSVQNPTSDQIKESFHVALTALHRVFAEAETYRAGMTRVGPLTVSVEQIVKSQIPVSEWLHYQIDFLPTADGQIKALLIATGSEGESPLTPLGLGILVKRAKKLAPKTIGAERLKSIGGLTGGEVEAIFLYQNTFFSRVLNAFLRKEMSDPLFDSTLRYEANKLQTALEKLGSLDNAVWKAFGIEKDTVVRYINIPTDDLLGWVQSHFPKQSTVSLAGTLPDKVAFASAAEDPQNQLEQLPHNVKFNIHLKGRIPPHIWLFAIDGQKRVNKNSMIEASLDPVNAAFAKRELFREVLFSPVARFNVQDITRQDKAGKPVYVIDVEILN